MKIYINILLIAFGIIKSQEPKIIWGDDLLHKTDELPHFYINNTTDIRGMYENYTNNTFHFCRFDKKTLTKIEDISVIGDNAPNFDGKLKDHFVENMYFLNGKLYLFSKQYANHSNQPDHYFSLFNDASAIEKLEKIENPKPTNSDESCYFTEINLSLDSTKFFILFTIYDKNENATGYQFKIIDVVSLKTISECKYEVKKDNKVSPDVRLDRFSKIAMNKEGMIYMPLRFQRTKLSRKVDELDAQNQIEKTSYRIVCINSNTGKSTEQNITYPGKGVFNLTLEYNKLTDKVSALALYSALDLFGVAKFQVNGFIFIPLNADSINLKNAYIHTFPFDIVRVIGGEAAVKYNKGIAGTFKEKFILNRANGGFYYILENHATMTAPKLNKMAIHSNDLLIVALKPDGKIEKYIHVPKYQRSNKKHGIDNSIYAKVYEDHLHILFNGCKDMIESKDLREKRKIKHNTTAIVDLVIENNGTNKIIELNNQVGDQKFVLQPRAMHQVNTTNTVFLGSNSKKHHHRKIALLTFD